MKKNIILLLILLSIISIGSGYPLNQNNGSTIYSATKTAEELKTFSIQNLVSVRDKLKKVTETDTRQGLTLEEYIVLAVKSREINNIEESEKLSSICSIANKNDETINTEQCMKGEIYPNIQEIFNISESVKHHGKLIISCYDSETLNKRPIIDLNMSNFINKTGIIKSINPVCSNYGDIKSANFLVSDVPYQDTYNSGSANGYYLEVLTSRSGSSILGLASRTIGFRSIIDIRNEIRNDCEALQYINFNIHEEYCKTYLNYNFDRESVLFPLTIVTSKSNGDTMKSNYRNALVNRKCNLRIWLIGCVDYRYEYSRTTYPVNKNRLQAPDVYRNYVANNVKMHGYGNGLAVDTRVMVTVARADANKGELTGEPSFVGVPAHIGNPKPEEGNNILSAYNGFTGNNNIISCINETVIKENNARERFIGSGEDQKFYHNRLIDLKNYSQVINGINTTITLVNNVSDKRVLTYQSCDIN